MFGRIVNSILNENVVDLAVDKLGMDEREAAELIKRLDFSDYTDLQGALSVDDVETAKRIIGSTPVDENSYAVANGTEVPPGQQPRQPQPQGQQPQGQMGDEPIDLSQLSVGDKVTTNGSEASIKRANVIGGQKTFDTSDNKHIMVSDKPIPPTIPSNNPDDVMKQIKDLQRRAGIEPSEIAAELGEKIGSPTAYTCAAMGRNGMETPNQLIDKHTADKRPGPKTDGSKVTKSTKEIKPIRPVTPVPLKPRFGK